MFSPESLNLKTLPAVSLENRKGLPQAAGIYMAIDAAETVQYIGRSNNLRKRWLQHHCQGYIANGGRIAYLEVSEVTLLPGIERALIQWFDPVLNRCLKPKKVKVKIGKNLDIYLNNTPTNTVLCKLKRLMEDEGLNQLQVSEATGLSPTTVGKLYRNQFERIDKATLITLCKYFRVGIEQLFEVVFEEEDKV